MKQSVRQPRKMLKDNKRGDRITREESGGYEMRLRKF